LDFPDLDVRTEFLQSIHTPLEEFSELDATDLAHRTSGLNLINIYHMIDSASTTGERISSATIAAEKKRIIEEYCGGLVKFIDPLPGLSLAQVATHEQAKAKLQELVWLVQHGKNRVLEKGILLCGRVGVGKSFLIRCFASECGLPVMELGNFRSKWVGDTERQLDRILLTISALGPVIVVVDEADAVLGNREESGDSGVSTRVFATLAAHIGDSSIRGKEIWIAMTSRPDLLAIDMKRQGRFGLCMPLFPAQDEKETLDLFRVIAAARGQKIPEGFVTPTLEDKNTQFITGLTGSEVESMLIRAEVIATLDERDTITAEDLNRAVESFIDPLDRILIWKQTKAAVSSVTDRAFLPELLRKMKKGEIDQYMGSISHKL